MMKRLVELRFRGTVSQRELDLMRERLGLTRRGRLGDDWDSDFGYRDIRPAAEGDGKVELVLSRELDRENEWYFSIYYDQDPLTAEQTAEWTQRIRDAAAGAGLTAGQP
jgi:hypothetical protein